MRLLLSLLLVLLMGHFCWAQNGAEFDRFSQNFSRSRSQSYQGKGEHPTLLHLQEGLALEARLRGGQEGAAVLLLLLSAIRTSDAELLEEGREITSLLLEHYRDNEELGPLLTDLDTSEKPALHLMKELESSSHLRSNQGWAALLPVLRKLNGRSVDNQTRARAEELILKYGEVEGPGGERFSAIVERKLFALDHLRVGKTTPPMEGKDAQGAPFRLSEFRGKVVLISFWATWCGPCMARLPEERDLVERFQGRPFVLLGVNADRDPSVVNELVENGTVNWRNWCDGGASGPIQTLWQIQIWPSFFLLDHRGVIVSSGQEPPTVKEVEALLRKVPGP